MSHEVDVRNEDCGIYTGALDLYDNEDDLIYGQVPIVNSDVREAMEECCGDKEVKTYACNMICELPDSLRDEMRERQESGGRVLRRCLTDVMPGEPRFPIVAGSSVEDLEEVENSSSITGSATAVASWYLLMVLIVYFRIW